MTVVAAEEHTNNALTIDNIVSQDSETDSCDRSTDNEDTEDEWQHITCSICLKEHGVNAVYWRNYQQQQPIRLWNCTLLSTQSETVTCERRQHLDQLHEKETENIPTGLFCCCGSDCSKQSLTERQRNHSTKECDSSFTDKSNKASNFGCKDLCSERGGYCSATGHKTPAMLYTQKRNMEDAIMRSQQRMEANTSQYQRQKKQHLRKKLQHREMYKLIHQREEDVQEMCRGQIAEQELKEFGQYLNQQAKADKNKHA